MLDLWEKTYDALISKDDYGLELLGGFLYEAIDEPNQYQKFFNHAVSGKFHKHYESYFISMPENLIEDDKFEGCVEIVWDNFDGKDYTGKVRLDKFCFLVKLSAIYHAKYVDPSFDPWEDFVKLDDLVRKYSKEVFGV